MRATILAASLACCAMAAQAADANPAVELRLHWDQRSPSTQGPLADANELLPDIAPPTPSAWVGEAEWRHTAHAKLGGQTWTLGTDALAWQQRHDSHWRFNELHLGTELGAWSLAAGKKVLGWDVGYGFRPNDMVQQELRRTLLGNTPEGRPLLQAEHFGSNSAATLVWVNPQHLNAPLARTAGAQESALAGRWYQRDGATDWYAFARVGEHTRTSLGAAAAWVAGDELELHASWRLQQRHDGWQQAAPGSPTLASTNPWAITTQGGAPQWLLGLNWTGAQQQGLLIEWWHDGAAPDNATWDAWTTRNGALRSAPAAWPAMAVAGNLAWQATPLNGANLRQDNLFVRATWQPGAWLWSLDALVHPADRGRVVTAGLQWQGDRVRLNASWRVQGGPATSVLGQLPTRRSGLLAATWAF